LADLRRRGAEPRQAPIFGQLDARSAILAPPKCPKTGAIQKATVGYDELRVARRASAADCVWGSKSSVKPSRPFRPPAVSPRSGEFALWKRGRTAPTGLRQCSPKRQPSAAAI